MKKILPVGIFVLLIGTLLFYLQHEKDRQEGVYDMNDSTLSSGKRLFIQQCASCHMMDGEAMGPQLGGVTSILDKSKLIKFVQNPAQVIASGDKRSNYLSKRYKTVMPPFGHLDPSKISNILAYIHHETKALNIQPLEVDTSQQYVRGDRVVAPVKPSGLVIELDDYLQIPMVKGSIPRKGIATLRAHPDGDGTLFISDQMGIIYKVFKGDIQEAYDIREVLPAFIFAPGLGTGLGSFALDPEFGTNGLIYITHAEEYTGEPALNDDIFGDSVKVKLQWVLSEWKWLEEGVQKQHREILRINTPTGAHGVQDIQFAPVKRGDDDYGMLFIGIGDGGSVSNKRPSLSHTTTSVLGTIIRIDPKGRNSINGSYGIPPDNPLVNLKNPLVKKEIWAYGFRNPHRMCWDMEYGKRMIVADVGEGNVEEVNIVEKGADYGWNVIEGNFKIDVNANIKVIFEANKELLAPFHLPFGQFDHQDGKAISGGFVYRGPLEALKDKYLLGDIPSGRLFFMNTGESLADSSVYHLSMVNNGKTTTLQTLTNTETVDLRIGYDEYSGDLFIMTKGDNMVRRVTKAYYREEGI